jgi:hypothetical protein
MMIDTCTGSVRLPSGMTFVPQMRRIELLAYPVFTTLVRHDPRVPVHVYGLPPLQLLGHGCDVALIFALNRLVLIRLSLDDAVYGSSWRSGAEPLERRRKEAHDRWLAGILGVQRDARFPWGTIESVFDDKGVNSYILIRYDRPAPPRGLPRSRYA